MDHVAPEKKRRSPYGGLFGESNLAKVIEQVIADPDIEYRPIDLEKLTKESAPTVRLSLKTLTSLGVLLKNETDIQHPVYRVNAESKRFVALTLLAYAVLDDENGTDSMNKMIVDYVDAILPQTLEQNNCGTIESHNPKIAATE